MPPFRSESRRQRCINACENCKRRKQRCNGEHPCQRCMDRNVESTCSFNRSEAIASPPPSIEDFALPLPPEDPGFDGHTTDIPASQELPMPDRRVSITASSSRLIQDAKGKHMFIGDSANLSFLQSIRQLVSTMLGSCSFVDDPLKLRMVEATPDDHTSSTPRRPTISRSRAISLLASYSLVASCVLDLFDESDLLDGLHSWLDDQDSGMASCSPKFYLVLAIGAQTAPDDEDQTAASFFEYGRHLAASTFTEDPSIETVQIYAMITMFLLGASRRNAAFMYLGIAVRAAYALGLHREDVAALFSHDEYRTRERVWRVIRILDLFMSASLGRPPSTSENRDTSMKENYSASADLCALFELILNEVYSKRMVSAEALKRITNYHRAWSARFREGLSTDHITPESILQGCNLPNIGLLHIKEAHYWTIILSTRPFLLEYITSQAATPPSEQTSEHTESHGSVSTEALAYACVDSAVRTIELLYVLRSYERTPRRLPFVVNSVFVSALVIGAASFGNFHRYFPLKEALRRGKELLDHFPADEIARRDSAIIGHLQLACSTYLQECQREEAQKFEARVERLFGQIHKMQIDQARDVQVERNILGEEPGMYGGLEDRDATSGLGQTLGQPNFIVAQADDALWNSWSNASGSRDLNLDMSAPLTTLWFDSFLEQPPLFSTIDTTAV